jgi:hypothetical protein
MWSLDFFIELNCKNVKKGGFIKGGLTRKILDFYDGQRYLILVDFGTINLMVFFLIFPHTSQAAQICI